MQTVTSADWTNTEGDSADTCDDDGVRMAWQEPNGTGDTSIDIDDMPSINAADIYHLVFNGYYTGNQDPTIQCYDGADWQTIATLMNGLSSDETIEEILPAACNDGTPQIRIHHTDNGDPSHFIYIDSITTEQQFTAYVLDPTVTYGDIGVTVTLSLLCLVIIIAVMIGIALYVSTKGGQK